MWKRRGMLVAIVILTAAAPQAVQSAEKIKAGAWASPAVIAWCKSWRGDLQAGAIRPNGSFVAGEGMVIVQVGNDRVEQYPATVCLRSDGTYAPFGVYGPEITGTTGSR